MANRVTVAWREEVRLFGQRLQEFERETTSQSPPDGQQLAAVNGPTLPSVVCPRCRCPISLVAPGQRS